MTEREFYAAELDRLADAKSRESDALVESDPGAALTLIIETRVLREAANVIRQVAFFVVSGGEASND